MISWSEMTHMTQKRSWYEKATCLTITEARATVSLMWLCSHWDGRLVHHVPAPGGRPHQSTRDPPVRREESPDPPAADRRHPRMDTLEPGPMTLTPTQSSCTKCNRHEECGRPGIPSRIGDVLGGTSVGPALFVIGEQPGFHEEKAGRCFVGKSGAYLQDVYLQESLLAHFVTVYLGNAIRCQHRRNIAVSHLAQCRPYLMQDIRAILERHGALVLLAIGRAATQCLLNRGLRDSFKRQGQPLPDEFWVNYPRTKKDTPPLVLPDDLLPKGWMYVAAERHRPESERIPSSALLRSVPRTVSSTSAHGANTEDRLLLQTVCSNNSGRTEGPMLDRRSSSHQCGMEKEKSREGTSALGRVLSDQAQDIDPTGDVRVVQEDRDDSCASRGLREATGSSMDLRAVSQRDTSTRRKTEIKAIIPTFSTYHPAALMSGRNPSYRRAVFDHLSLLCRSMETPRAPDDSRPLASGDSHGPLAILADVTWTKPGDTHRTPEIT